MGALRIISRNIASNAAGHLVAVVTAFLLTPFVVHTLGDEAYGIWGLVVSLTGYYGILDLGIRSAVGQYVTRYWALRDIGGVNRTISTAVAMTLPIALLLLVPSVLLSWYGPRWFGVAPEDAHATQVAILIMGISVALSFPFAVFGSATYARQRFDISNLVGITERLTNVGLAYWVLCAGYGLVGIALTTASTQLAAWLVRVWIAYGMLPGLSLSMRHCSMASVRELWGFGLFNFLINVADRIVLSTDVIVISLMLPKKGAVTYYTLGADLVSQFMIMINAVAWALTPYATARDAEGDREALRRLWRSGSKNIFLLASVVGSGLIFLGHDFLSVWVGAEYVSGKVYASSATIMAVLAGATLLRGLMTCGKQILFGMREVRFLARLSMLEAGANLALSVVLIKPLGLLGVALGTLIPIMCTQLVLQPRFLSRKLDVSLAGFFGHSTGGGLAVLLTMGFVEAVVAPYLPVDGWGTFVGKAVVVTSPAVLVGVLFGTTKDEKALILRKLGRKG